MDKRDLDAVWTVLETAPPPAGIEVSVTGWVVSAGEVLAGLDAERNRHLLIPLMPGEAARTDTRGRAVQIRRVKHQDAEFLTVICLVPELRAVFSQFAGELVSSIEAAGSPARAAVEMFDRWRSLFSEAAARGVIGEQKLVGLIGELLVLEQLLDNGAPTDAAYWTGPGAHQHDFRSPCFALEVKSTTVREGRIVGISSVDQLEAPPSASLWLVHHQLERDPAGLSLQELVARIQGRGCDARALVLGLTGNDVDPRDLGSYADRRFRVVGTRMYDALAAGFPRIARSSFKGGDIPPGTLRLSYSIDLTNEPPTPLPATEANRVIKDMAGDAAGGTGS